MRFEGSMFVGCAVLFGASDIVYSSVPAPAVTAAGASVCG